jgi:hypothetical protein
MCISKETREAQYKPQSNILYQYDPQFQRLPSGSLRISSLSCRSLLYSFLRFLYRVADKFHILLPIMRCLK